MDSYYHYTDKRSLERIIESGFIKASTDQTLDCAFGKGVYLNTLDPNHHDKKTVAQNNYDGRWQTGLREGKVNSYIKVDIPWYDPHLQRRVDDDRDINLYEGNLSLGNFNWSWGHKKKETVRPLCAVLGKPATALQGMNYPILGKPLSKKVFGKRKNNTKRLQNGGALLWHL